MIALANVNGVQMPLSEVRVSALDRGFLFGDAVYEVLRVYAGKPFLLDEHMERLAQSLKAIRISGVDLARMRRRIAETIAAGDFREAIVYIQVTRGAAASRSHFFPPDAAPLELLWVEPLVDTYGPLRENGVRAVTLPDIRWERCDIKSTNLLANVLSAQAAKEAGAYEALLYLPDGTILEGTRTSCFSVLNGCLLTAPRSPHILPGITRGLILKLAQQLGIPFREQLLNRSDLQKVTELFLTGTTSEVLPVVDVDDMPIGSGLPGPITRRLQEGYRRAVHQA